VPTAVDPGIVLAGFYPPPFGGESTHVMDLAGRLRATGRLRGIVNLRRGAMASPEYVQGAGPRHFCLALARLLSRDALLHLHTNGHSRRSWGVISAGGAMLRLRGASGVLTLHSGLAPAFLEGVGRTAQGLARAALTPFRRLVAVNEEIRDALARLGVPPARVSVVPAFLGLPADTGDMEDTIEGGAAEPLISVVAGDGPEYGLPLLLEALPGLAASFPSIGCVVVGVEATPALAELARRYGVDRRVHFLGSQPRPRCLAVMRRSALFVRPSLADGDAVSVREALALGISVVASATGARPPGVLLFRTGDAGDLTAKIVQALENGRAACAPGPSKDFFAELLGVYRMAAEECA
jgi:glycogen synthase